ncbi:MAG: FAD-dependent oxidoreductase [Clostridia bacterium]|nr:FAD-dependent oxidoreductase [Clostridia bacterium]
MAIHEKSAKYDVVVIGGGLAGMCAAIASARNGARTAIIQNRSMFGGNASSEIRMHILGANCHSSKPDLRETGIVEEILLENKRRNPYASFPVFDSILWEKIYTQQNLTAYLNTNVHEVIMRDGSIRAVRGIQNTTETEWTVEGSIFIDATGHGTVGVLAGAASRTGSESKHEFDEPTAPEVANDDTMGNSLMFIAVDRGEPVPFEKPEWAYTFTEEQLRYRPHTTGITAHRDGGEIVQAEEGKNQLPGFSCVDAGYWWIELGGQYDDIIEQAEEIRDELMKCVYGVWDHLKNGGDHGVDHYDLDWVGIVPGYRESRRLEGKYILTENDIRANRRFEDAVAYGGWPMDVHVRGGLRDFDDYPSHVYNFEGCYTIPYRCFVSKNVDNLMMAGRDISASKMAFSSTRVMGTCAVGGQAAGTAAALAIRKGCKPEDVGRFHIAELQQTLLKQDCYIPGCRNQDGDDLARSASVRASSQTPGCEAEHVISGVSRNEDGRIGYWESDDLAQGPASLFLSLAEPSVVREVRLTFDTDLDHEIQPSTNRIVREKQVKELPHELVKDYTVALLRNGETVAERAVRGNGQRLNVLAFDPVECDEVRVTIFTTHGLKKARVFETRVY